MGVGASGFAVGDEVGLEDGFTLGADVGCKGDFVGPRDGARDGNVVGSGLGLNEVEEALGEEEGLPVGSMGNTVG